MTTERLVRRVADVLGRGAVAGLVGTAAMTVSSTIEARLTGRGSSSTPADAASTVLGVQPTDEGEQRFGTLVHWAYGTGWGAVRGLIGLAPLPSTVASLVHFAAVWSAEQGVLPATGSGSPVWTYGGEATATDVLHHAVYSAATGVTFAWLDRA